MTEEKGDEEKSEMHEYLENEKNFLNEVKCVFHNYLSAIIY